MVSLRVNRIHFPVAVLGPGRRVGIWLQGCSIGCVGCLSKDTWDSTAGQRTDIETLVDACRRISRDVPDGITISGGEPMDQPEALLDLLDRLHLWRAALEVPFDILCYTGRSLRWVQRRYPAVLDRLDAIIAEPYLAARPQRHPWCGSDNQSLRILSDLGRERFLSCSGELSPDQRTVQVAIESQQIWLIGMPRQGDLDAVEKMLHEQGVRLEHISWRS